MRNAANLLEEKILIVGHPQSFQSKKCTILGIGAKTQKGLKIPNI